MAHRAAKSPDDVALRGREATQRKLEDAAVELIERDGILAGLNLREVADHAGVNRGNIYHYFGSRQELLRSAFSSRVAAEMPWLDAGRGQRLVERKARVFRGLPDVAASLLALLAIDGDEALDPLPDLDRSLADLSADVDAGDIDPGHDLVALQLAFQSLTRGYELLRERYAARVGVPLAELDQRVEKIVRGWLAAMREPPRATRPAPDR